VESYKACLGPGLKRAHGIRFLSDRQRGHAIEIFFLGRNEMLWGRAEVAVKGKMVTGQKLLSGWRAAVRWRAEWDELTKFVTAIATVSPRSRRGVTGS